MGKSSQKVINSPEEKHSSHTVCHECFGNTQKTGRFEGIQEEISDEFFLALAFLRSEKDTEALYYAAMDKKCRIREIIEDIYHENAGELEPIIQSLESYTHKYESECNNRKKDVLTQKGIIFCPSAPYPHPLGQILENHIENKADIHILIDAHELGKSISPLLFITGDYNDIVKKRETILPHLQISGIRGLLSF